MTGHRIPRDLNNAWFEVADPGDGNAIPVRQWAHIGLVTLAAETRTLDDPIRAGQRLVLTMITDGGDCVITADAALNQTGNTIMTFAATRDTIALESILTAADTYMWQVMANDGVALS